MSDSNLKYDYINEQDYLDGEKLADSRHEYVKGKVYAMAGSSKRHNRIALNLVMALNTNAPCEVYT